MQLIKLFVCDACERSDQIIPFPLVLPCSKVPHSPKSWKLILIKTQLDGVGCLACALLLARQSVAIGLISASRGRAAGSILADYGSHQAVISPLAVAEVCIVP